VRRLEEYCDRYGLVKTGGSDYHGPPEAKAGTSPKPKPKEEAVALNQLHLPLDLLEPLKQAATALGADFCHHD
jgi:hypothetical protein